MWQATRPDRADWITPPRDGLRRRWLAYAVVLGLISGLGGLVVPPAAAEAACGDLSVSAFSSTPADPIAGRFVFVTVTVRNVGTCAVGEFVTQMQSPQAVPRDWPVETTPQLAAGATTTLDFGTDVSKAGAFDLVVVVDLNNAVIETDETNNRQLVPVVVRPATVDLAVTEVALDPVRPVRGRPMSITATIHNFGTATEQPFNVAWTPAWNQGHKQTRVDGLGAGAETKVTFRHTYQTYWTFDSGVGADTSAEIPEPDELNNFSSFQVPVDPVGPDLVVQGVHLSPSNPLPGQAVTAAFDLENTGNSDATGFRFQWQPWPGSPLQTSDVAGLAAGATRTVSFSATFPAATVYQGAASVDPLLAVKEIEEGNNAFAVTVPVAPNRINLRVVFDLTPKEPRVGELVTVEATVTNLGNTASGPFDVDWNPDATSVLGPGDRRITQDVNGLARGERRNLTFHHIYARTGSFSTVATADADDRVVELTSADNRSTYVVPVSSPDVDLTISDFSLAPGTPTLTSLTTASVTVKNVGTDPAGPFDVLWKLPGSGGANTRSTVGGLAPGESRRVVFGGTFDATGSVRTSVVVDPLHQVMEPGRGEDNNTVDRTITVRGSKATR